MSTPTHPTRACGLPPFCRRPSLPPVGSESNLRIVLCLSLSCLFGQAGVDVEARSRCSSCAHVLSIVRSFVNRSLASMGIIQHSTILMDPSAGSNTSASSPRVVDNGRYRNRKIGSDLVVRLMAVHAVSDRAIRPKKVL